MPTSKPRVTEDPAGDDALALLRAELTRLREEVAALKAGASLHGATDTLPSTAVVVANEHLAPEQGFYPLEHTEDGVAFCWTGPSPEFSLEVWVDRSAGADMRLDGINFLDFDQQQDVDLQVDGESVPANVGPGGSGVVITAPLPARSGMDRTKLVFTLPSTLTPPNTADTRHLGLAFCKLVVTSR